MIARGSRAAWLSKAVATSAEKHLQGPLTLATTDRNLTLDGVRGAATITDRNGSVALTLAAPLQPVHISNTNGTVDVSVPSEQPFTLHAKAQDADIHNDLNLPMAKSGSTGLLDGQVLGGGPELDIQTSNDGRWNPHRHG